LNFLEPAMVPPLRPGRSERAKGLRAPPRRASRAESARTQARILDAAETLYVEMGFAATSLRAIAERAGVNLASAHYHFGSKEGLLGAMVERRVEPLNEARIRGLEALEAVNPGSGVEEILEVFFAPLAEYGVRSTLPRVMARLFCEPESISKPLLERVFGPTCERFIGALGEALPDQDIDEVHWRFHFVTGAMIHLLNFDHPLEMPAPSGARSDALQHLLDFAAAGFWQIPNARAGGKG